MNSTEAATSTRNTDSEVPATQRSDLSPAPLRTLYTGSTIPAIGLGTFGSDHADSQLIAETVCAAIQLGYRMIDCAACYGNEHLIGPAIKKGMGDTVNREEMFIISKLWNDQHDPDDAVNAVNKTLSDLQLEYLDAYLVHWPFSNYHEPFAETDARNALSTPYVHEEFMKTWHALEGLVDAGLIRHLGTSNMTIPKLKLVLQDARIKPAVNEMELHPTFQQGELFQFCLDNQIQPIGYSPIGSPRRPERDRTEADYVDLEMPQVVEIAQSHGVHPAVVCLKWAYQRGQIPIPFSTSLKNVRANLEAITTPTLSPEEMESLKAVDRNCRLIKGQVFLWPGSDSWLDLWDVDGTIPGWDGYGSSIR